MMTHVLLELELLLYSLCSEGLCGGGTLVGVSWESGNEPLKSPWVTFLYGNDLLQEAVQSRDVQDGAGISKPKLLLCNLVDRSSYDSPHTAAH